MFNNFIPLPLIPTNIFLLARFIGDLFQQSSTHGFFSHLFRDIGLLLPLIVSFLYGACLANNFSSSPSNSL